MMLRMCVWIVETVRDREREMDGCTCPRETVSQGVALLPRAHGQDRQRVGKPFGQHRRRQSARVAFGEVGEVSPQELDGFGHGRHGADDRWVVDRYRCMRDESIHTPHNFKHRTHAHAHRPCRLSDRYFQALERLRHRRRVGTRIEDMRHQLIKFFLWWWR